MRWVAPAGPDGDPGAAGSSDPTSRCAASGTVTLVPSGGRLRMTWVDADRPTNKATGVLTEA